MTQRNKADTFIGFAVKSGAIVRGVNALDYTKEKIELLLICHTAAKNTVSEAQKISRARGVQLIQLSGTTLESVVNKENCKLCGITDKNLAKAIISHTDGKYLKFFGGGSV